MPYPVTTPPDGDPRPKLHHRRKKYAAGKIVFIIMYRYNITVINVLGVSRGAQLKIDIEKFSV
jgi:hypothetical protein